MLGDWIVICAPSLEINVTSKTYNTIWRVLVRAEIESGRCHPLRGKAFLGMRPSKIVCLCERLDSTANVVHSQQSVTNGDSRILSIRSHYGQK
mmetsp:Transcript_68136/g.182021  ORF Transcript_68136/g.182021 Transcript_68136/m.182021 type:complete len:93 (+) Transcript_68136:1210-1488(+)